MEQEKVGKFIASCRKDAGYTQLALAEKLGVTDRAVSKWENGRSMPDVAIMQELCTLINIDVNELLSGEKLSMDNYKEQAEKNLIMLKELEEESNKRLLSLEVVLGYISSISFLVLVFAASFAVTNPLWQTVMILAGLAILNIGGIFAIKIEHDAGYYECPNCGERYVPSMKAVLWAPHIGRSRKMRCPYCNERGYHKKRISK